MISSQITVVSTLTKQTGSDESHWFNEETLFYA